MMRKDANAPSVYREHQICFFESHFVEMKSGWISGEQGTSNPNLQFMVSQNSKWKTEWKANVWHNIAYEIVSSFPSSPFPLPLSHSPFHFSLSTIHFLAFPLLVTPLPSSPSSIIHSPSTINHNRSPHLPTCPTLLPSPS